MICFRFRLFLFLILMIVQGSVSAQQKTTKVYGKVYSSDDVPASFVTLTLQSQGIKTKADINGSFSFTNLPALKDTLVISGVGFKTLKQAIALQNNQNINLDIIRLKYRINQLRHVEITACIKTSYKSDYSSAATKMPTAIKDLPLSVSTVTKELINDRMEFHLSNALENVSGVTHYSGYEEYNIRGLHAENPCLINGLRTFNTSLTSPQLLNVEKVELIKGPACVLYGNADPGGTVNLVIKKPLRQKQAVLEIGAGSWNAANMQADFTGPLNKSETWLYRLNAGYENKDSFRQGMFLKSTQIAPSFSFIPNNKLQVNLDVSLSNTNSVADRGQPGFRNAMDLTSTPVGLSLIQPGDYLKETNVSALLSANYKFNSHISFNTGILGYMTWQRLSEHFLKNYITNDSVYLGYNHNKVNTSTLTLTNYFVFQFNTGRLNHELVVGYDFISSDLTGSNWNGSLPEIYGTGKAIVGSFSLAHPQYFIRPVSTYLHMAPENSDDDGDGAYHTQGLYVQEKATLNKWLFLAGLRADFYTAGDAEESDAAVSHINKLIPSIGVTYAATQKLRLYATYNKGFDPFEPTSVVQVFNEPFKPVNSEMIEVGTKADFFKNKLLTTIALYQIIIDNVAVNANDVSNPNLYVQRGEERSRGIETEIQGYLLPNLSANIFYTYNVAEISKSINPEEIGKIKENAPRHSSSSWFKYSFERGWLRGFGIGVGHIQASARNTLTNGFILPGYVVFNSGIQYSKKHFIVAANLNNLANKTYWVSAYNNISKWPGEPRNFMLKLGYHL